MDTLQNLIKNLNTIQRNDPYSIELLTAISQEINALSAEIDDFNVQYYFDTMTWYIEVMAQQMQFSFADSLTLQEKREALEARYKSDSKADLYTIKAVAQSWATGEVDVQFTNGKIIIEFIGQVGIPTNIDDFVKIINDLIPCHLEWEYKVKYNTWEFISQFTWGQLSTKTWADVYEGKDFTVNLTHEDMERYTNEELESIIGGE